MSKLPFKLPAPPPRFVGRDHDLAWLHSALARAPIAVIVGRPGLGKTALVATALGGAGCVYVRASAEPVAAAVGRALGVDGELEAVLARADERGATVVVDDLHRAPAAEVRELLVAVRDHARDSKWIAVSRTDPMCQAVEGQLLTLPPLPNHALLELAREIAPSLDSRSRARAVAAADGAPGALWRALDHELLAGRDPDPRALETLPDDVRQFVEALALFSRPVSLAIAGELGPVPDDATRDLLISRGLMHESGDGVSLTDGARAALSGGRGPGAGALGRAAARLGLDPDPGAAVEAVRLYRLAGDDDSIGPLLAERGDEILEGGGARALWQALADAERVELAPWKLRCAVACGDPRALARARRPVSETLGDRLAWARILRARGELKAAAGEAAAVAADAVAAGDDVIAFEAGDVRGRALAGLDPRGAIEILQVLVPPDAGAAVLRDARLAAVWSRLDAGQAQVVVDRARGALHTVTPRRRAEVVECLAGALARLGALTEAARLLDGELTSADDDAATTLELCYRAAAVALKRAEYDRAEELLARLERLGEGGSGRLQRQLAVLDGFRAIARGEYGGLEARLTEELAGAANEETPGAYAQLAGLVFLVRTLTAAEVTAVVPDDHAAIDGHTVAELMRVRRLARIGAMEPGLARACAVATADSESRIVAGLVAAEAALLEGDYDGARTQLAVALELTQRHGYASWDFALRVLACEVSLIAGDRPRAVRIAGELAELGKANRSRCHQLEAELLVMASSDAPPDPAVLERIADAIDAAPVASRRARVLLGGSAPADRADALFLDAVRRLPGWADLLQVPSDTAVAAPAGSWHSGWGLDEHRKQVWLTSGETVDFSRWPVLWSLLRALAATGRANKEELVRAVWNEPSYHPLRHDNRLHAAVRKLRHAIEEDPSRPRRVLTTSGGYRLGGFARRMVQR